MYGCGNWSRTRQRASAWSLGATRRVTTTLPGGQGLLCADERTHEAATNLRERRFIRQSRLLEERSRVFRAIDPRRLEVDVLESCAREFLPVRAFLERARDTADPQLHAATNRLGDVVATDHDVGYRESTARLEHPE